MQYRLLSKDAHLGFQLAIVTLSISGRAFLDEVRTAIATAYAAKYPPTEDQSLTPVDRIYQLLSDKATRAARLTELELTAKDAFKFEKPHVNVRLAFGLDPYGRLRDDLNRIAHPTPTPQQTEEFIDMHQTKWGSDVYAALKEMCGVVFSQQ